MKIDRLDESREVLKRLEELRKGRKGKVYATVGEMIEDKRREEELESKLKYLELDVRGLV